MIQALHFKDEKSDKFWFIETLDCELMVNYGKTGVTGKYEIKEFDTVEECEKEALKLINSKKKKGYQEFPEFDRDNHYYFDDEECGLHILTSHINFRKYFTDEFYYDCGDEEAPFGSDEGNDALYELQEAIQKKKKINFFDFPKVIIEKIWEMDYLSPDVEKTDEELMYVQKNEYDGIDAVVEITEVINEFTYYAKNSIVDRDIILDMEKDMDLKKGDRIYIEGSLQIELEEYKERLGLLEDWKR